MAQPDMVQEVQHFDVSTLAKGSWQINHKSAEIKAALEVLRVPLSRIRNLIFHGEKPREQGIVIETPVSVGSLSFEVVWPTDRKKLEWQIVFAHTQGEVTLASSSSARVGTEGVPANRIRHLHCFLTLLINKIVDQYPNIAYQYLKEYSDEAV